jgi:hypothetical protein
MFNLTPIVKNLLFINVVMFLVPQLILPNHNSFGLLMSVFLVYLALWGQRKQSVHGP